VKPADIIALDGKLKFRTGVLKFLGTWDKATEFVLSGQMAWVFQAASGAASATGASGAASATGERGAASATGWSGAASATGTSGAASATGWSGAASATGESSASVVTGIYGKAKAGEFGCIALAWWNPTANRAELRCACTGEGQECQANVWYTLDEKTGTFIPA